MTHEEQLELLDPKPLNKYAKRCCGRGETTNLDRYKEMIKSIVEIEDQQDEEDEQQHQKEEEQKDDEQEEEEEEESRSLIIKSFSNDNDNDNDNDDDGCVKNSNYTLDHSIAYCYEPRKIPIGISNHHGGVTSVFSSTLQCLAFIPQFYEHIYSLSSLPNYCDRTVMVRDILLQLRTDKRNLQIGTEASIPVERPALHVESEAHILISDAAAMGDGRDKCPDMFLLQLLSRLDHELNTVEYFDREQKQGLGEFWDNGIQALILFRSLDFSPCMLQSICLNYTRQANHIRTRGTTIIYIKIR